MCDYVNRRLKLRGRYHGAAAVLVHLQRGSARHFVMTTANVGDVQVVLCHQGEAVLLTRKFVTSDDRTECQRVCKLDGFITTASCCMAQLLTGELNMLNTVLHDFIAAELIYSHSNVHLLYLYVYTELQMKLDLCKCSSEFFASMYV